MALLTLSRLVAPPLIVFGVYALIIFGVNNGFHPQVDAVRLTGKLPPGPSSSTASFNPEFGVGRLDQLLGVMLVFFWPIASGHNIAAGLTGVWFAGQSVAGITVGVLEGARYANKGKFVSYSTIWGMLVQVGGYGVAAPAHLALSLFTSPLITASTALTPSALSISEGILSGLPVGIVLGFIVPTVVMALPQPSIISVGTKIFAILFWQPFPVHVAIFTYLWGFVLFPRTKNTSETKALANQRSLLRTVYQFALVISASAHVAVLSFSISTVLFPGLFAPEALVAFAPSTFILPPNPFSDVKISSLGEGDFWFLQWDNAIAAAATLLLAINSRYAKTVKKADAKEAGFGLGAILSVAVKVVAIGPMSTALTLLWERDEAVYSESQLATGKKTL